MIMWNYEGKFIEFLSDGKIRFLLKRKFTFPIDFGFKIITNHNYELEATQDLDLYGLMRQDVLDFRYTLTNLMAGKELRVVTMPVRDTWEAIVYVGDRCLNDIVQNSHTAGD